MSKLEKFTLIFTISSFALVFLLGSQGLILKPLFSIDVTQESDVTKVKVQNVGMAQAKNAALHVISTKPLNMTNTECVENSNIELKDKQIKLKFDRFSTGINCIVNFDGKIKFDLQQVTISADDTAGVQWNPIDDLTNRLLFLQFIMYGTISTVIAAIAGSIVTTYLRKQTRSKVKGYKTKEDEIREEIRLIEDELNTLQKRLSETNNADLINSITRRIRFLDDRIRILYLELDQIKSSITLEGKLENVVGEFYINWAELEQQILRIAENKKLETQKMNLYNLIKQLQRKDIVSKEFFDNFNIIRKFRNGLVHGFISPQNIELTKQTQLVKKLIDDIKDLNTNDETQD